MNIARLPLFGVADCSAVSAQRVPDNPVKDQGWEVELCVGTIDIC